MRRYCHCGRFDMVSIHDVPVGCRFQFLPRTTTYVVTRRDFTPRVETHYREVMDDGTRGREVLALSGWRVWPM